VVVTATGLAYGFLQLVFGPLGDHFGKLRVVTWACLASTAGALACAASPSLDLLALARALNGATTAALIPLSLAWIGDAVGMERRQATLARFMTGQIVGLVSGHAIGGFFAEHLGWRWGFVFLAGIYLVVGLLLLAALRGQRAATAAPARVPGRYRLVLGQAHGRFVLAMIFVEAIATFGVMTFIPAYLHQRFGISLFHAGLVVATVGLGGLGYTLFARRWVKVLGPRRLARSGGLLLGVAFLMLGLGPDWPWGVLACGLLGLGFYQLHNTLQTLATQTGARGARHRPVPVRLLLLPGPGRRRRPGRAGGGPLGSRVDVPGRGRAAAPGRPGAGPGHQGPAARRQAMNAGAVVT
jgi:YNFM family putative membrane transporter